MGRIRWHQPSQNLQKLPRPTPGPIIDDHGRRIGTNPGERGFGEPMMVHDKATEDKCDSSWAYLSSYIYHQPLPGSQKSRNLPRSRPPGAKTLPLSDEMGQIPATEALGCRWVPIRRLRKTRVIVVGHTYRVIYITSPSQNLKNLPRSTPGPIIGDLEQPVPVQTSVQALESLFAYVGR